MNFCFTVIYFKKQYWFFKTYFRINDENLGNIDTMKSKVVRRFHDKILWYYYVTQNGNIVKNKRFKKSVLWTHFLKITSFKAIYKIMYKIIYFSYYSKKILQKKFLEVVYQS